MGSLLTLQSFIKSWAVEQFELQRDQAFLWWPVCVAVGVALYFAMPVEVPLMAGACGVAVCGLVYYGFRGWFALAVLLMACGFLAGQVRTSLVDTALIAEDFGGASIEGRIYSVEYQDVEKKRARFVLDDVVIEGLEEAPRRVRLTVRSKEVLPDYQVGARVEGYASLTMPGGPVFPGGFNFRQYLYFQKIGGVGFFFKPPVIIDVAHVRGGWFQSLRQGIAARVLTVLPDRDGAVATALLNGQRGLIADADLDAMRYSGLAHILAISGLHVGLFSGVVFFVLRLSLVCIPGVALRLPVKKIAAVMAFGAACFYMMLAGATIPTQRAVLMIGVVFLAVLLDRTAFSMRLVAFAALVVLLLMPESLLSVSFQLSFAAVVGLIFVYDLLRPFLSNAYRQAGFVRKSLLYVFGIAMTSVVATFFTAPFALYHFQTLAAYGLLGNVIAMPIMSVLIMPMAVIALALMPFGLEGLPLWVMGQGIEGVLVAAHFVSGLDGAIFRVSVMPPLVFGLIVLGALWFVIVRGWLRVFGLLIGLGGAMLFGGTDLPDILVSEKHGLWAYQRNGALYVSSKKKDRFVRENWEHAFGLEDGASTHWREDDLVRCDEHACRIELEGRKVSFVTDKELLPQECAWADVLVSERNVDESLCTAQVVIDYNATKYNGVHAVYLGEDVRVKSVGSYLKDRPWN